MRTIGIITAGGSSSRMGTDKAEIEVEGVAMIDRIADTLLAHVDEVLVVGGNRPGSLVDHDEIQGPLAGLAAGLAAADGADAVFFSAVDHPFLQAETVRRLINRFEGSSAVVPVDREGIRQVLCAVYSPIWAEQAEFEGITLKGNVQSLIERLGYTPIEPREWEGWEEDGRSWFSVDSSTRLEDGLRRFGGR
ncbi:MAG: NTP transferase domain-containing protein [Acidimicrobiia bacterium]|nr:NTP transferase domain-containing protein [Acidimicrobiia bacterium]MBT8250810.1 NTP transferase domain-containing protein [Acidimicrobiia bacterium]NNC44127.1 NTP transferase domain-containing protein [Acidimicrobiia bacterium]NNL28974.1 NTP transferase domain-containing protein [Acidimicrobiia bacterium]NNL48397.1 NTP transferase domain-containing protein [Acidimicrobiia bacterium]